MQHSIICEKHLPYYIFTLLDVNKMYRKTTFLKVHITQKQPIKSFEELDLESANESQKKNKQHFKSNTQLIN